VNSHPARPLLPVSSRDRRMAVEYVVLHVSPGPSRTPARAHDATR
jgi:hypothetical protein